MTHGRSSKQWWGERLGVESGHLHLVGRAVERARLDHPPARGQRTPATSAANRSVDSPDGRSNAPIGTYGARVLQPRQGAASLAGDSHQQRKGSFADTDRVNVTHQGDAERARITGPRGAPGAPAPGRARRPRVDRAVGEPHQGHAILLVDLREIAASEIDARLEKLARAAWARAAPRSARLGVRRRAAGPTPARGRATRGGACFPARAGVHAETDLPTAADDDHVRSMGVL